MQNVPTNYKMRPFGLDNMVYDAQFNSMRNYVLDQPSIFGGANYYGGGGGYNPCNSGSMKTINILAGIATIGTLALAFLPFLSLLKKNKNQGGCPNGTDGADNKQDPGKTNKEIFKDEAGELTKSVREYRKASKADKLSMRATLLAQLQDVKNLADKNKETIGILENDIKTANDSITANNKIKEEYGVKLETAQKNVDALDKEITALSTPAADETPEQKTQRETKLKAAQDKRAEAQKDVDLATNEIKKADEEIAKAKDLIKTKAEKLKKAKELLAKQLAQIADAEEALQKIDEKEEKAEAKEKAKEAGEPEKTGLFGISKKSEKSEKSTTETEEDPDKYEDPIYPPKTKKAPQSETQTFSRPLTSEETMKWLFGTEEEKAEIIEKAGKKENIEETSYPKPLSQKELWKLLFDKKEEEEY